MQQIIDSKKLLAFHTLCRVLSFTVTARELHLTQSAISHAIAGLERDLGVTLFNRLGRTVTITEAGGQLLVHAEAIIEEMGKTRESMAALKKAKSD
ncbi:LysR family transcriptional regulator (plasmid) [Opitutaceae bacterium TAV5]|nr:LysR family transcriptional regulator [Opitutaceae bacterium TAV5]